jgi:hypothetical protein
MWALTASSIEGWAYRGALRRLHLCGRKQRMRDRPALEGGKRSVRRPGVRNPKLSRDRL